MFQSALLACLLTSGAVAGERLTGAAALLPRSTTAGGGRATGGGFILDTAVGEAAGGFTGAGRVVEGGYAQLFAFPGTVTALTALSKSSGTLELAWTAPGRDGGLGSVAAGFYRVDYSTDAGHAFAQDSYRLEIPTAAVPGALHALTLTGLAPNATYYARVWLGDERRSFAEDSARSEESTLAGAVVNPVLASVLDDSALITWTLPSGGAASFRAEASTAAGVGGLVGALSVATTGGLQVSLTVSGLTPDTTYFFQVASLNSQGQPAYTVVLATRTPLSSAPLPVAAVGVSTDSLSRTVRLSWSVTPFANSRGVLVVRSTQPTATVPNGSDLAAGQTRPDGGVVRSTAPALALADTGLALNTSYFYHLFSFNQALAYSVRVTTAVYLDLPPAAPAGLSGELTPDGTRFKVAWSGVSSNMDGSAFQGAGPAELSTFELLRSTTIIRAGWVAVSTAASSARELTDTLPDPSAVYYYRVDTADAFGTRGTGMVLDTRGSMYALAQDGVTRLQVPASLVSELRAAGNSFGTDLTISVSSAPGGGTDRVLTAARFETRRLPDLSLAEGFRFSAPTELHLSYAPGATGAVPAAFGPGDVGVYWDNGSKFVKLFGKVDPVSRTVTAQTPMTGTFQVRQVERSQGFSFNTSQLSNKAITPNGDGLNDAAVFTFDNPADAAFSGRIYDIDGSFVADMTPGPIQYSLRWDGKAGGQVVPSGVYVYQVRGEDKVYNGTVVVVR